MFQEALHQTLSPVLRVFRTSRLARAALSLSLSISLALLLPILVAPDPAGAADSGPATSGVVTYEMSYEGVGPMASFLPKEKTVTFDGHRVRTDFGEMSTTILDKEKGITTMILDMGDQKVAFRFPESKGEEDQEVYDFEPSGEYRDFAGVRAERVDVVDPTDPNNRLGVWVTKAIGIDFSRYPGLSGFALEFVDSINEGESLSVAKAVKLGAVAADTFEIPEGTKIIELDSADAIPGALEELSGDVEVLEMDSSQ